VETAEIHLLQVKTSEWHSAVLGGHVPDEAEILLPLLLSRQFLIQLIGEPRQKNAGEMAARTPKSRPVTMPLTMPPMMLSFRPHAWPSCMAAVTRAKHCPVVAAALDGPADTGHDPPLDVTDQLAEEFDHVDVRPAQIEVLLQDQDDVAGHLGDTVETVSRTYVHWLRDDRDVPAAVLERVLAPPDAPSARHDAAGGDS
jgi:hypothetical protein